MTRPATLLAVLGTGTEIGKTWVSVALLTELRARGLAVSARKPVQSFAPGDGATDAELLGAASGEDPSDVCPPHRGLPVPMAPPMAAEVLGFERCTANDLLAEVTLPEHIDVALIETVGGVRAPMTDDTDSAGFVRLLGANLAVLVGDAALGTINAVRLSAATLEPDVPVVVMLNRYDDANELHRRNRAWLADRDGFDVVVDIPTLATRVLARHVAN